MIRHQNQAIAQKLGILEKKVTSMTGLRIQKYLTSKVQNWEVYQALNMHIRQ